jgi:hypothetical protein
MVGFSQPASIGQGASLEILTRGVLSFISAARVWTRLAVTTFGASERLSSRLKANRCLADIDRTAKQPRSQALTSINSIEGFSCAVGEGPN